MGYQPQYFWIKIYMNHRLVRNPHSKILLFFIIIFILLVLVYFHFDLSSKITFHSWISFKIHSYLAACIYPRYSSFYSCIEFNIFSFLACWACFSLTNVALPILSYLHLILNSYILSKIHSRVELVGKFYNFNF